MMDTNFVYEDGRYTSEYYFTRIKVFYIGFSIWGFSQIWFWFTFAQNFSDENSYAILADPEF